MTELRGHLAAGRHGVDIQLVDLWSEGRGYLVNTGVSTGELELEVSNSHLAEAFKDLESNIVGFIDRFPQVIWVVAGIVEGEVEGHRVKCRLDFFEHSKTTGHITCVLSKNISMLIGFRFLQGFFGSASLANGGGTISDMYDALERTRVVGWYILGPLTGPAIGAVIGGFMTESLLWRWTFWLMLILSLINTTTCFIFLHETYAPVLLSRKAAKLQKKTGQPHRPAIFDPTSLPRRLYRAIQRPIRILLQPLIFVMAVYIAFLYGTLFLLFTTFPQVFEHNYGFSPGTTGLTYLGVGLGFMVAILFGIPQIDKQYRRLTAKNNGVPMPEFRLPVANVGAVCIPISLLWHGWAVQAHTFYLVPIIGTVFFGIGTICIFNTTQNFYIDAFTRYAASAIAAGTLFRSVVGAAFPVVWGGSVF